jgi:hypothetical protein
MTPTHEQNRPPGRFVRTYITSKRIHAAKLLALRDDHPLLYFTARWPVVRDISFEQARPAQLWFQDNVDDALRSEAFVCHAEKDDLLSGSLVELGIAWHAGLPIWLSGENEGFKEWKHAPRIRHVASIDQALKEVADLGCYDNNDANRILTTIRDLGVTLHAAIQTVNERQRQ